MKKINHSTCISILLSLCFLPIKAQNEKETVSWVGATWSYYMYDYYPRENYYPYENDYEEYSFFRYTVLDRPEVLDGKTYYPLVWYTTCEYEEDHKGYRIRQEGKKVLMRKEDCDYEGILKEIGNDYVLYDFSLNEGEEYCKYNGSPLTVLEVDTIQDERGQTYRQLLFQSSDGWETWIDGIGSTLDLLIPYTYPQLQRWYWHRMTLNYFCSADSSVIYRNPRTKGDVMYPNRYELANRFDHFKEEDCSLKPSRIKGVIDCSPIYIKAYNSKISCTAPDAVSLEVYTMDAVKVGEARFVNGEATIKVGSTLALYLYIVTYPDGHRESGKVVVSEE